MSRRCLKSSIRTAELALEHVTRARPGTERVRHFWRVFWCPVSYVSFLVVEVVAVEVAGVVGSDEVDVGGVYSLGLNG